MSAPEPTRDATRPARRNDGPRRIKSGVRFRRKEGLVGLPWPGHAWVTRVDARADDQARADALDYARAGQVAALTIHPGGVESTVQGRAPRPYHVRIDVVRIGAPQWDSVIATMASEAIWSAKLLSGELPVAVEQVFASIGCTLVPQTDEHVTFECSCAIYAAGGGAPCKHILATWYLVAERVEADPLLSFTLRGLDGQKLLERLQEARAIATRGISRAHSTPAGVDGANAPPPVDRCIQDFWKPGRRFIEALVTMDDEHVPHALLRRLGPSPFQAGANRALHAPAAPPRGAPANAPPPPARESQAMSKFPLVGLLASIYDSMAIAGRALRERDAETSPDMRPDTSPDDPSADTNGEEPAGES